MTDPLAAALPDPLGQALHYLRMDGAFYGRSELTAPWGLTMPRTDGYLWFHVVTNGRVLLETAGDGALWLQPGDVAEVEIDGLGTLRNPVVGPVMMAPPGGTAFA
jgi:hypothetical protein